MIHSHLTHSRPFRVTTTTALSLCLFLSVAAPATADENGERPNLIGNGSFNEDIEGWRGLIVDRERDNKRVERPDFVEHVAKETEDDEDPEGMLQITLDDLGYDSLGAHQSGVHVNLTEPVPAESKLRVRFEARSLGGSPLLRITRAWGGSSYDQLAKLSDDWQSYEIMLTLDFDTSHLIWTLVEGDTGASRNRVAMGRLQLNNVHISVVEEDTDNDED